MSYYKYCIGYVITMCLQIVDKYILIYEHEYMVLKYTI